MSRRGDWWSRMEAICYRRGLGRNGACNFDHQSVASSKSTATKQSQSGSHLERNIPSLTLLINLILIIRWSGENRSTRYVYTLTKNVQSKTQVKWRVLNLPLIFKLVHANTPSLCSKENNKIPALKMLSGSQTFKLPIHHDRQSCTQSLALFHTKTRKREWLI